MNTYTSFLMICLLSCLGLLTACSDAQVQLTPSYYPRIPEKYTLETFEKEWEEIADMAANKEEVVIKDLLAHAPSDFDWSNLWNGFATGKLRQPKSSSATSLLMGTDVPKCRGDTVDEFIDFLYAKRGQSALATQSLCYVLSASCDSSPNGSSMIKLGEILVNSKSQVEECRGHRDAHLLRFLNRLSLHSDRAEILDGIAWSAYFNDVFASEVISTTIHEIVHKFTLIEEMAGRPSSLIEDLFTKNVSFGAFYIRTLRDRYGIEAFARVMSSSAFIREFRLLDQVQQANAFSIIAESDVIGMTPRQIGLNLKILSLYASELDENALVAAGALNAIDDFNHRILTFIRSRTDKERMNYLVELQSVAMPTEHWRYWLLQHFETYPDYEFAIFDTDTLIEKIFMYRLYLRDSARDAYRYRIALKKACRFYDSIGMKSRTGDRFDLDLIKASRGCIALNLDKDQIQIVSDEKLVFSPDLVVILPATSLHWVADQPVFYGFFDLSTDSLNELPVVPEPLVPAYEDSAIAFNTIVGVNMGTKVVFFPFHFVAREPTPITHPDPDFVETSIAPSGSFNLTASHGVYDLTVVSHGYDGMAGARPRKGGSGDVSYRILDYQTHLRRMLEPIYSAAGIQFEYKNELSRRDWTALVEHIEKAQLTSLHDLAYIDEDLLALVHPEDRQQMESFLNGVEIPADGEWENFCLDLEARPDFESYLNKNGHLDQAVCERVYRLEYLTRLVLNQILARTGERAFNGQFTQQQDFIIPDLGMSPPGKAQVSGDGGNIFILSKDNSNLSLYSEPGVRFLWPDEWNVSWANGEAGKEGELKIENLSSTHEVFGRKEK